MIDNASTVGYSYVLYQNPDTYLNCIIPYGAKILTEKNIDEFDKFPAIRQYFPYQNFPFS